MKAADYPDGVWLVDFEFRPIDGLEGSLPEVVCLVARKWPEGPTLRLWQDELQSMRSPPIPFGNRALFVAYYASAEMDCLLELGWPLPANLLDLYVEFRWLTNGQPPAHGNGLLGG